ncbi:hypothetical protein BJF78_32695 [Pseudonocardia sp. CNS-139]|nr:hypothetical protein BJF78_32695 [Pseudonocardia sp. CNS-139]
MSARASSNPRPARGSAVRLWDGRVWPCAGRYAGAPVFRYGWAPSGLATVRQLAADRLRPGGQDVAGWLVWGPANRPRWAYLFRRDLAAPKRPMTAAMRAGIERCNAAQQLCPTCGTDVGYRIPRSLGECWDCAAIARGESVESVDQHAAGDSPDPWAAEHQHHHRADAA